MKHFFRSPPCFWRLRPQYDHFGLYAWKIMQPDFRSCTTRKGYVCVLEENPSSARLDMVLCWHIPWMDFFLRGYRTFVVKGGTTTWWRKKTGWDHV